MIHSHGRMDTRTDTHGHGHMDNSMSEMLLVGLRQEEWEDLMKYLASNYEIDKLSEVNEDMDIIIKKLTNQIY